ncbi:MAG: PQQ-dependent sugar dehydrogenase [Rhodospirillales bacterium]|nr:PQQ-dependent sugar dehydrogenase [Rhodospirillales bacterium]
MTYRSDRPSFSAQAIGFAEGDVPGNTTFGEMPVARSHSPSLRRIAKRGNRLALKVAVSAVAGSLLTVPVAATERTVATQAVELKLETVARGLVHPWGLAILPDGRMLVTERPGRLRVVGADGSLSAPLAGVPAVFAEGQGGLLDVALGPDFAAGRDVYLCYAEAGKGGAGTAVARGRLADGRLDDVHVIFRQQPKVSGGNHFGCRLVFAPDGHLFVTLGERFKFDPAQDLASHLGKVVRIHADGRVPTDNPFAGRAGALPEIWSFGHRNVQGAAIDPRTGALWTAEFGPMGGDEVNVTEAGKNYGWPLVSWGSHYSGREIPDPSTRGDFTDAIHHWTPAVSPSGIAFYTGEALPGWHGNLLLAGLSSQSLIRLSLDGTRVTAEERIALGERIRHVRQGPGGAIYLLIDSPDGEIWRLSPARK